MPSDRVLPLRLLLPVIQVQNTAIGHKAGTPALGEISGLWGGVGESVIWCVCCLSIHTRYSTLD